MTVDFEDLTEMIKQEATLNGIPNMRSVHASRYLTGPEDVDNFIEPMLEGLTRPLTTKEKESGKWESTQKRILFEGTLDEAETFYQQTKYIPYPVEAPIAVYTDGLPIRVPTEERVREMLTGTSHKPDEVITLVADRIGMRVDARGDRKRGDPVLFEPLLRTATVEKVATIAVMAGCKPEHLPVVLAIAQSGCLTGSGGIFAQWAVVSGPIVKEIGMNTGCGLLNPGSPANMPIGRTYQLMALNLGGAVPGVNRMNFGSPLNTAGTCFAEKEDGLPPGWKGLNEEHGFEKNESIVLVGLATGGILGAQFSPGGYR